ncbi:multicopper oxidase family protein [Glycomyces sp. NRRL B-16210]|uniref:multicopper oxidase family protein n=1 Tax=Glycomyces sp. NRRL B-16210 TaxID=1463821 RepID=UPI0004C1E5A3|nr:multicopper oxidase domain-containing protein [Glycomyces sp. NRRL B-16210]
MKRRSALKWTLIGVGGSLGALTLGTVGVFGYAYARGKLDTVGKVDFDSPLAVPPLAESHTDASGARVFDLDLQAGQTQFLDGPATATWGVNGAFLGPTIRASRGEEIAFAIRNDLDQETSIHWHGMHLPAVMDGGPHQSVAPGDTWAPQWTVDQPAATLWYHPHPHGRTADHVHRGLAGMFIVDDEESGALDLPSEYGVDDLPMIVQDRKFDDDNQFDDSAPLLSSGGVFGDEIIVNGTRGPYVEVTTRLVRLRLLNGSNSRLYNFGFGDDRAFQLIATDGGLLAEPWETDRLHLSPGERAEIVVAFAPGETVELRSYPAEYGFNGTGARTNGADDRLDLVQFRAADTLAESPAIPTALAAAPDLDTAEAAETRTFTLEGRNINDRRMDMGRIDFAVREGTTEVWEVVNTNGYMHNFHVHDVQFHVLTVDGDAPPPDLSGWKDTILLVPDRRYRLAMRFTDHTDPNLPYMYHCHLLAHEDEGMMGQFVVLGEGETIGEVPQSAHAHD